MKSFRNNRKNKYRGYVLNFKWISQRWKYAFSLNHHDCSVRRQTCYIFVCSERCLQTNFRQTKKSHPLQHRSTSRKSFSCQAAGAGKLLHCVLAEDTRFVPERRCSMFVYTTKSQLMNLIIWLIACWRRLLRRCENNKVSTVPREAQIVV